MALEWITKSRTRSTARSDVNIRVNMEGKGKDKRLVARFEPEAIKKLAGKSAYLICAFDDENDRIYFKEDGPVNGYKLTWSSAGRQKLQISFPLTDAKMKDYVGDYQLLFDRDEKLYYIDKSKKLA